ncbi:MAG: zinc-binding dehydrogenase [Desulfohalobiaceae bacterium]|nr:zinc-binding dehydrogenase [Desulfohalobiaceae bacterium]
MKCLRKLDTGPGNVRLVDLPKPRPQPGQVLVQVKRAGICGTDLHIFHGQFSKVRPPVTLGHEISGVVAEVGSNTASWTPGERVTVESEAATCGQCRFCQTGRTNLCPQRLALGYGQDGGFAEFVLVRESALHRLPDKVGFSEGSLCEPLAVAVHAVREVCHINPDSSVLITGPGTIGLLVLQLVHLAGARAFLAGLESDELRFEVAEKIGQKAVLRAGQEPIFRQVAQLCGQQGVDVAFECSGSSQALNEALQCLKPGGSLVQVGLFGTTVQIDFDQVVARELNLHGSFVHTRKNWEEALRLLRAGQIDLQSMISLELPIAEWRKAFEVAGQGRQLKVVLSVDNSEN